MSEHGAYRLLLDHYYATEGKIPAALEALQRLCRASTDLERAAVAMIAERFFPADGAGTRHNKRADEEVVKWHAHAAHNREIGKLGGRPKEPVRVNSGFPPDNPYGNPELTQSRSQKPEARYQKPAPGPDPENRKLQKRTAAASRRGPENGTGRTKETETAYRQAMAERYGEDPGELNGKQRGMLSRFLDRVPLEEAPAIVRHYVASSRSLYAGARHCIDLLLRDAESIRLMWRTGSQPTDSEARQEDETATRGAIFNKLIAEAREKEKQRGK